MAIPAARPIANPATSLLKPKALAAPVKVATGALLDATVGAAAPETVVGTCAVPFPYETLVAIVDCGA